MNLADAVREARYVTLEQIKPYLPGELRREGNSYRLVGHSGLIFFFKGQKWRWHWFSRDEGGDLLDFLTKCELGPRMSFQEAVMALTGGPWSSGGHKSLVEEKRASSSLKLDSQLPRHDVALWTEKALAFCRWCHEQLISPSGADVRTWLETERGLHVSTIEKFGLGWNPRQFFRAKRDWGVDDDGTMALPSGLVVPKISVDGRLEGATVRRLDDAEAQRWGKYHVIPSPYGREIWSIQQEPMDDPRRGKWPLVIVEGELDGLLLAQECVDINIAVLGSAGRKPHNIASHRDFWLVFTRAQKVFLCLDNDEAGQRAMSWWLKQWTHTVPLPPPGGHKDPTEAYLAGHDLKGWLLGAFEEAGIQGWPLFSLAVDTIGPKVRNKQQFRLDSWKI